MIQSIKSHYHPLSKTLLPSSFHKICNDQQSRHCITCIWHECLLPQSQGGGGSFLILQDVMGWATGFFIPCLGEGQQKTVSTETDFADPTPCTLWPVPNHDNHSTTKCCFAISCKRRVIFYQEGRGAPENWGGSGTLSKIKRGDQKIFSN